MFCNIRVLSKTLMLIWYIRINDNVVELLIMISACKGGSARSITGKWNRTTFKDYLSLT